MKRKILDFSIMKEELSQNNVLEMAELNISRSCKSFFVFSSSCSRSLVSA